MTYSELESLPVSDINSDDFQRRLDTAAPFDRSKRQRFGR